MRPPFRTHVAEIVLQDNAGDGRILNGFRSTTLDLRGLKSDWKEKEDLSDYQRYTFILGSYGVFLSVQFIRLSYGRSLQACFYRDC